MSDWEGEFWKRTSRPLSGAGGLEPGQHQACRLRCVGTVASWPCPRPQLQPSTQRATRLAKARRPPQHCRSRQVQVIRVRIGTKQRKGVPEIEPERLAVTDGHPGRPDRIGIHMQKCRKIGKEWLQVGLGKRVRFGPRK